VQREQRQQGQGFPAARGLMADQQEHGQEID